MATYNELSGRELAKARRPFLTRQRVLRKLGFASYQEYLASDLWKGIRERVLADANHTCRLCGRRATQVHHTRYNPATMRGMRLNELVPVCGRCHKDAEFEHDEKATLETANDGLGFDPMQIVRCVQCGKRGPLKIMTTGAERPVCRACNPAGSGRQQKKRRV